MRALVQIVSAVALFGFCAPEVVQAPGEPASTRPAQSANAGPASAAVVQWRCVHVVDGDTLDVQLGEVTARVRLLGIDTPERGQPGYKEATENLRRLAQDKPVRLERPIGANGKPERDTDKYGRILRRVFVEDIDLSEAQLAGGFAKPYDGGKRATTRSAHPTGTKTAPPSRP